MPGLRSVYEGNDNRWEVEVKTSATGLPDTGATVTGRTEQEDGTPVETGLTLTHDGNGVYSVVLDETAGYVRETEYWAVGTVVGGSGEDGEVWLKFVFGRLIV